MKRAWGNREGVDLKITKNKQKRFWIYIINFHVFGEHRNKETNQILTQRFSYAQNTCTSLSLSHSLPVVLIPSVDSFFLHQHNVNTI